MDVRRWLRREVAAAAEAIPRTIVARWPTVVGMGGLALSGLLFASGEVRNAIVFAAAAAVAIDLVAGVSDRVRTASDRALAADTVGGAAKAVLDAALQFTEGTAPMTEEVPDLSLRGIYEGARLFTAVHDPASMLGRVRRRLLDNRQLYAASAGTQVVLLDDRARRVAVDAQRELDAAIIALDRMRDTQWRHDVLQSSGVRGKPLEAFDRASLTPQAERFHELARSAAALLRWLEDPRGGLPRRDSRATSELGTDRRIAARAIIADAIDWIIRGGGRTGNWISYSNLAAIHEPSLRDIAALDELVFQGQAIRQGWAALQSGLREDMRSLRGLLNMVQDDLDPTDLERVRRLVEQLGEAATAAGKASDAEGAEIDAGMKQLPGDQIKAAHDVFAERRAAFRDALRVALETMHEILSTRPTGFGPDDPRI